MFSNPFGGQSNNDNSSESSDDKDMLGDITDQSIDTSTIEDNNTAHKRGFSNPFNDKFEAKLDGDNKPNLVKEEPKPPVNENVIQEQVRPSVKDLIKNFQPKKVEKIEEKAPEAESEARGSVRNLISRFENKQPSQGVNHQPSNLQHIEPKGGAVASIVQNIETKVATNTQKDGPFGTEHRDTNQRIAQEEIKESHEAHEESGLGLDDYSQSFIEEGSGSVKKMAEGFANPYKDVIADAAKVNALNQSYDMQGSLVKQVEEKASLGVEKKVEVPQNFEYRDIDISQHMDKSMTDGVLGDITADDDSLDRSGFKPMMNNPLGLNKSYLENRSQLDVSRSRLNYSNISQFGQKPQTMNLEPQGEDLNRSQFNLGVNIDFNQQNVDLRVNQLDEHMLSQITDDTQDLSYMTIPRFKNAFYDKDNSYYLNMTALNQSNISAMGKSFTQNKTQDKNLNKSQNKTGYLQENKETETKDASILGELYVHPPQETKGNADYDNFEPRPTGQFGMEFTHQQKSPEKSHGEHIDYEPRPTGQFGQFGFGGAGHADESEEKHIGLVDDARTVKSELAESRVSSEIGGSGVWKEQREAYKETNLMAHALQVRQEVETKEQDNKDLNTSQIGDVKDAFKFSQLDISKISVFDVTQDNEDMGLNQTVNNFKAFLSTSQLRGGTFESDKKDYKSDSEGDITLEFHQEIAAEPKKNTLELDKDHPKISEVSMGKEETQVEENNSKTQGQEQAQYYSMDAQKPGKNISSELEGPATSKSFNAKQGNSFIAAPEPKNKSFDEAKPIHTNYVNTFEPRQQEVYDNRLTVGNLPQVIPSPVEQRVEYTSNNPFTGVNKSYDNVKATYQDSAVNLNKSYDISKPYTPQGQETAKVEQLDYSNRFTFQITKPLVQGNNGEVEVKTQSFEQKGSKEDSPASKQDMNRSDMFKEDLLKDEKSFSELDVSQDQAIDYKKFVNPVFMGPQEGGIVQQQENKPADSGSPQQVQTGDRAFEGGFTLGGHNKFFSSLPQESENKDYIHKSFDGGYAQGSNVHSEAINKSFSPLTESGNVAGINRSGNVADIDLAVREKIDKMQTSSHNLPSENSYNKTSFETPNFDKGSDYSNYHTDRYQEAAKIAEEVKSQENLGTSQQDSSVSMHGEGLSKSEGNHKTTSEVDPYYFTFGASVSKDQTNMREAGGIKNESFDREKMQERITKEINQIQMEQSSTGVRLPLKFRKQDRPRPQITAPKGTVSISQDTSFDFTIPTRDENRNLVQNPVIYKSSYNSNVEKKYFGYKVKKDMFIRGRKERQIKTDNMEVACPKCSKNIQVKELDNHSYTCYEITSSRDGAEEIRVQTSLEEINQKLQGLKDKLQQKSQFAQSDGLLTSIIAEVITQVTEVVLENSNVYAIERAIGELKNKIENIDQSSFLQGKTGLIILINRAILLSKEKSSKLDLAGATEYDLSRLKQMNQTYEKETLEVKPSLEVLKYQAELMHKAKIDENQPSKYIKTSYKKVNETLHEISSDIDCSDDEDGYSTVSSVRSLRPLRVAGQSAQRSFVEGGKKDTHKIKFYLNAMNYKLELPPDHRAKNIVIADLYEECLEKSIPEKDWKEFIKEKFSF